jgi:Fe-S-cluster containining protein
VSGADFRRQLPVVSGGRALRLLAELPGAEHLGFRCSGCGECCHRLRAAVTHHDLRRLSEGLGRSAESLVEWLSPEDVDMTDEPGSFVRLAGGKRLMVLARRDGACGLQQADQRCGAYSLRPLDCRLYPFDLERDEQGTPVRLSRLDAERCGDELGPAADFAELTRLDAERWRELGEYQELLQRWNALAGHRSRFRQRLGGPADFLAFLGFGQAPSPPAAGAP